MKRHLKEVLLGAVACFMVLALLAGTSILQRVTPVGTSGNAPDYLANGQSKVTPYHADVYVSLGLDWYEHADKH